MNIPNETESDKAFILTFERSPPNEKKLYFRFFVTARRLLQNCAKSNYLHADSTYKITVEKLPLIVIGCIDMKQTFHLIGFTITSNETADSFAHSFNAVRYGMHKLFDIDFKPSTLMSDAALFTMDLRKCLETNQKF